MACIGCLGVAGLSSPDARAACQVGTTPVAGIVNTYYPGVGSATAGSTTVTIGAMDTNGAATAIQAGDRILIMQMQDATINYSNSISYGNGSAGRGSLSINNSGLYEYATVTAVSGSTLTLSAPLGNSYVSASATATRGQRTFQVIRVPQYQTVTLAGSVTAPAWNGATGGVVAIDALSMTLSGTIDVSGKGFRGGWRGVSPSGGSSFNTITAPPPTVTPSAAASYNAVWVSHATTLPATWNSTTGNYSGGFKGEGIAGTPSRVGNGVGSTATVVTTGSFYPADPSVPYPASPTDLTGNLTIGAPGNAGGGGASVDASGGGGSNAGAGGQGGTWSGWMTPVGLGGAAYAGSLSATRLFMGGGGGGGASEHNSNQAFPGTAGGGIVMLRATTLSGTGTILASGQSLTTTCAAFTAGDGNGGTGAGGSVLVQAASSTAVLAITARGGDQTRTGYGIYAGGGGGGAVYSSAAATINVTGGTLPGTPASPLAGCSTVTNNNATLSQYGLLPQGGSVGSQSSAPLPPSDVALCALPVDLFLTKTNTPGVNGENDQASDTVASGEIRDYVITVSNLGPGAADGAAIKDPAVAGLTCTTASCTASGGASCPTQTGAALVTALQGATGALVPVLPANGRVVVTLTCQVQ